MDKIIDKKYEDLFKGYKNESTYRKNIVKNIDKTNYKDLKEICRKIGYGLSNYDVIRIAEAYKNADKKLKLKIEYILTDINFHYECGEIKRGHANEIIEENKKEIIKQLKNEIINIFENIMNTNHNYLELDINSELLKEYSLNELKYLKEQGILDETNTTKHTFKLSEEYLDKYLEKKWDELEDKAFNEIDGQQILDEEYWDFTKGITTNEDIWHYFDDNYSKGVHYLIYEYRNEQFPEEIQDQDEREE